MYDSTTRLNELFLLLKEAISRGDKPEELKLNAKIAKTKLAVEESVLVAAAPDFTEPVDPTPLPPKRPSTRRRT